MKWVMIAAIVACVGCGPQPQLPPKQAYVYAVAVDGNETRVCGTGAWSYNRGGGVFTKVSGTCVDIRRSGHGIVGTWCGVSLSFMRTDEVCQ